MATEKKIHSMIVDTGPLIRNTISISTMINSAENIYSTPAVLTEIRDPATRSRVETTLLPFMKLRTPTPASYEHVVQFSKKTGDFAVLSRQDLGILALAYEIEQERVQEIEHAQKQRDAEMIEQTAKGAGQEEEASHPTDGTASDQVLTDSKNDAPADRPLSGVVKEQEQTPSIQQTQDAAKEKENSIESDGAEEGPVGGIAETASQSLEDATARLDITDDASKSEADASATSSEDDSEGGEWITPSNIKRHQAKDSGSSMSAGKGPKQMSSATMTTDYAMQNVLLHMHLTLLSPQLQRVKTIKSHIMRCHACFLTTKEMTKQFCPRCGQPTLQRVSCSTNAKGKFQIHLAKNYQWNNRGNRYSVPKPVAGTASGKGIRGGGKGGWGNDLLLAEDQKEYSRQISEDKRTRTRDLMDEDYLPGILTGDRGRAGGRPKVGAGRSVNSRKRY